MTVVIRWNEKAGFRTGYVLESRPNGKDWQLTLTEIALIDLDECNGFHDNAGSYTRLNFGGANQPKRLG